MILALLVLAPVALVGFGAALLLAHGARLWLLLLGAALATLLAAALVLAWIHVAPHDATPDAAESPDLRPLLIPVYAVGFFGITVSLAGYRRRPRRELRDGD